MNNDSRMWRITHINTYVERTLPRNRQRRYSIIDYVTGRPSMFSMNEANLRQQWRQLYGSWRRAGRGGLNVMRYY